ncbi:MAG: hypothetical protein DI565_13500 [Ancylobacter novellus]|uniref:Uncharacterized protein n=1 Tax=Ancylobacter novellus TaxID=921 RepID=A0A2W5KDP8_ANCNO|nr:MAG: hypothetical protein DI565_13500 [Ancylobacter novellus]
MSNKHQDILNASSNLLGISLVIIAGLKVSGHSADSYSDEVACLAALCLCTSCILSYAAIRAPDPRRYEKWADRIFLCGLFTILVSVGIVVIEAA